MFLSTIFQELATEAIDETALRTARTSATADVVGELVATAETP